MVKISCEKLNKKILKSVPKVFSPMVLNVSQRFFDLSKTIFQKDLIFG